MTKQTAEYINDARQVYALAVHEPDDAKRDELLTRADVLLREAVRTVTPPTPDPRGMADATVSTDDDDQYPNERAIPAWF